MNILERSLIEKTGYDHGWENVRDSTEQCVILYSARHPAEASVVKAGDAWQVSFPLGLAVRELEAVLPEIAVKQGAFTVFHEKTLGVLLRRAAELAMSLPNITLLQYEKAIQAEDNPTIDATEALRMTKQRIGQNLFRQALMDYWGGACALSGIALPAILRASHIKPWAICDSDTERLDVFNGLLLCAHYDALFDAGLISFTNEGAILLSNRLDYAIATQLALNQNSGAKLRWISLHHRCYLTYHRDCIFHP